MTEPHSGLEQDLIAHLQAELKKAQAMLKLKQEDWIKVCQEYDEAEKRIEELSQTCIAYREAKLEQKIVALESCLEKIREAAKYYVPKDIPACEEETYVAGLCNHADCRLIRALALTPKEAERK